MVRRHPHVFGEKRAADAAEVLKSWEQIKQQERRATGKAAPPARKSAPPESLLDGIPGGLPALMQGFQLTRRAARVGFDWDSVAGIFDKLAEEARELRHALSQGHAEQIEGELGDLLFVGINLARFLKLDPEIAVKKANAKFSRRFREMELIASERGSKLTAIARPDMEQLWEQAKARLAGDQAPLPKGRPAR
jgi:MazG family protein